MHAAMRCSVTLTLLNANDWTWSAQLTWVDMVPFIPPTAIKENWEHLLRNNNGRYKTISPNSFLYQSLLIRQGGHYFLLKEKTNFNQQFVMANNQFALSLKDKLSMKSVLTTLL